MMRMTNVPPLLLGLTIWLICASALAQPQSPAAPQVEIVATDPAEAAILGFDEQLYLRLAYRSAIPLRFEPRAFFEGEPRTFAARVSHPRLHPPGEGEALAWISFSDPTHIDEVRINLLDAEWRPLDTVSRPVDLRWRTAGPEIARQPAAWVDILSRAERRQMDYVYDPVPQEHGLMTDLMFLITVASAPVYLLLQVQMLRRYRGRWRELSAVPLITAVPLTLYAVLIGFDLDPELWLAFLFRCTPFALLYLLALWLIKRLRTAKQRSA